MKNKKNYIIASSVLGMSADCNGLKVTTGRNPYVLSPARTLRVMYDYYISLKFYLSEMFCLKGNLPRTKHENLQTSLRVVRVFDRFIGVQR